MKTHTFNVDEIEGQMLNQLLISAVSPRPIALVSSIDDSGKVNLSPFSFFNIFMEHFIIHYKYQIYRSQQQAQ